MKKNGFVSMTLVYTFLILFLFLMLAILNAYSQQNRYIDAIDKKIDLTVNTPNRYEYCPYVAGGTNFEFRYTGESQVFIAACTGKYKIELWGAKGSGVSDNGGKGAYVSGEIELKKNNKIYFYVGEKGKISSGTCSSISYNANISEACYSGGGATDVRLVGDTSWDNYMSLPSRIMVAAGGGGAGYSGTSNAGGYGGIILGGSGMYGSIFSKGGAATIRQSEYSTEFGIAFGLDNPGANSSSGGGGYFAGESREDANSAGGSSYVSGYSGCVAIRAENSSIPKEINGQECSYPVGENMSALDCSTHYSNFVFSNIKMLAGDDLTIPNKPSDVGNDGYAVITYLSDK